MLTGVTLQTKCFCDWIKYDLCHEEAVVQNVGPVPGPGFDPDSSVVHFRQQRPFCEGQEEDQKLLAVTNKFHKNRIR